jgi:shikimate kinase
MSTPTVPDRLGPDLGPALGADGRAIPGERRRPRPGGGRPRRGPANVILVGLSGSGKTTVARLLARRLGWRFVDTDQRIQRQAGLTVQEIFRAHGEVAFRALESDVVAEVCRRSRQVIATGGGAVMADTNRALMVNGNLVVYLACSPETLAGRLGRSLAREPRPLLENRDLVARLAELGRQRDQQYRCAHHVVQTDQRTPREVVDVIAKLVRASS